MDDAAWRSQWDIDDDGLLPTDALHSSGVAFKFVQTLDETDAQVWVCAVPQAYQAKVDELQASMGAQAFEAFMTRLYREALQLWRELGHEDG